jgi:hypothetical protein
MSKEKDHKFFIEPHKDGFAVLRPDAQRPSAVEPTQADAIDRAKQIDPKAGLDIARVRHTKNGHPDQFRKQ